MQKRESVAGQPALLRQANPVAQPSPAADVHKSTAAQTTKRDQLSYLSDMIDELGTMADRIGCPTLAGILDLAKREADLERSRT